MQAQAAYALGLLKDERAVKPLISALNDDQSQVQAQAAYVLGQLEDKRAVEPLINALKDDKYEVREQAAFALGQLKDERAVGPLIDARNDENYHVQRAAHFVLDRMGYKIEMPSILDMEDYKYLKGTFKNIKFEEDFEKDKHATTSTLIDELRNNDSKERADAARLLGRFWKQEDSKDKRVVPALINALSDDNNEVREQAADALAGLAKKPDIPALVRVLGDSKLDIHTKVYAATVLVKLSRSTHK